MIRLGRTEDITHIIALTKSCGRFLRENGIDQWDENYPSIEIIEQDILKQQLFCYIEKDELKGIVVLNENQDPEYEQINWLTDSNSKNLIVHRLAVDPKNQGRGIARKLMDYAEDYGKKNQYNSIRLDTFSRNLRNQRFYSNRNYHKIGEVYLSYRCDYPYYCYELPLDK